MRTTIDKAGRVVIPREIRRRVGLEPGDVENDAESVENMHDLGETIAWLLKNLCKS